jgi:hypothetical protein
MVKILKCKYYVKNNEYDVKNDSNYESPHNFIMSQGEKLYERDWK